MSLGTEVAALTCVTEFALLRLRNRVTDARIFDRCIADTWVSEQYDGV